MKRQEKSPVEREDLYEFRFVSEASLSPDGTMAVCVVNQASKEDNTYHSSIWSVDLETKEKRLLASRGEAKKPVWLDSGRILFTSSRDREDTDQKEQKPEHSWRRSDPFYDGAVKGRWNPVYGRWPVAGIHSGR